MLSFSISIPHPSAFREEPIYFVDKDNDTGESELYSLDDFPVRLNEDVRKAYLSGRFGAVPDII